MSSYTYQRTDNILSMFGEDGAASWNRLQSVSAGDIAKHWKKELANLAKEYHFSPRFSIMRLVEARCKNVSLSHPDSLDDNGFSVSAAGQEFSFPHVTIEYAQEMDPSECLKWITMLTALAAGQPDSDASLSESLIYRAWYDEDSANDAAIRLLRQTGSFSDKAEKQIQKQNTLLFKNSFSRDDAFLLGHILGFTLTEMEFFLLRSLDEEEGIHFRSSNDLIECFGFLAGYSGYHVETLKQNYAALYGSVPKADNAAMPLGITRDISDNLPALVEDWQRHPEQMEANFMKYLEAGAPYLDCPSVSATTVYRNLAVWALDLMEGRQLPPAEDDFFDCIDDVLKLPDAGSSVQADISARFGSLENCRSTADLLVKENQIQAAAKSADPYLSWRVLRADTSGNPTLEGGRLHRSDRITQLLHGELQVEKADLLYLLWFVANFIWQSDDAPDEDDIFCRVCDFVDIANKALHSAAITAPFHVPHLMEHSMLLSIACGGQDNDPAVIYEQLMVLFAKTRDVAKKAKNHSEEQQLQIITQYRQSGMKLKDFAKLHNISDKTISYWQKRLVEKGLLPPR